MSGGGVGWFGGTFDPFHCGHFDVARAAHEALGLSVVHLVPARVPPHRRMPVASAEHRLAMVTLAAEEHDWLAVSSAEMTAAGPSYTVDTLDRLASEGVALDTLHVIVGADAFESILSWKDAGTLLDRCPFVVVSRPGHPAPALRLALPSLSARFGKSIFLVDAPTAPVSSTEVRSSAAAGESLEGLVPHAIANYIDRHALYRGVA